MPLFRVVIEGTDREEHLVAAQDQRAALTGVGPSTLDRHAVTDVGVVSIEQLPEGDFMIKADGPMILTPAEAIRQMNRQAHGLDEARIPATILRENAAAALRSMLAAVNPDMSTITKREVVLIMAALGATNSVTSLHSASVANLLRNARS